jgi:hypothetical protein
MDYPTVAQPLVWLCRAHVLPPTGTCAVINHKSPEAVQAEIRQHGVHCGAMGTVGAKRRSSPVVQDFPLGF